MNIRTHEHMPRLLSFGMIDPCTIWEVDGDAYRRIPKGSQYHSGRWSRLWEFCQSDLFRQLQVEGFIMPHELNSDGTWAKTKLIRPDTSFRVWTNLMLRDAMLNACNMNLFLIENQPTNDRFIAVDANAGNLGFNFCDPIYIDIGSFTHRHNLNHIVREHMASCHANARLNIDWSGCKDLNDLKSALEGWSEFEAPGHWDDYSQVDWPVDRSKITPRSKEEDLILRWCRSGLVSTAIDVGCNSGRLSLLLAREGIEVIGVDSCPSPMNRLYRAARSMKLPISCIVLDVSDLWKSHNAELMCVAKFHRTWQQMRSEACIASSVMHHLSKQMNFSEQARLWDDLSDRYLMIEWIDPTDVHLKSWDLPEWYRHDVWLKSLTDEGWEILETVAGIEVPERTWYLMRKL